MKKWVGYILAISLTTSATSAAWWPFGKDDKKPVANETSSVYGPMPRVSPRLFTEPAGRTMSANAQKPIHQHSLQCGHFKPDSAGKAFTDGKHPLFDRSETELQKVIQSAEAGNLKSSYMMYLYYTRHQDSVKSEQWREKTRQLAEKAPPEDKLARSLLQKLNSP